MDGKPVHELIGPNKEEIKERIDIALFPAATDLEVDIYVDADQGIFKFCMVTDDDIIDAKTEGVITGLNNSKNEDGWLPHLHLYNTDVQFRICEIDSQCYGKSMNIN